VRRLLELSVLLPAIALAAIGLAMWGWAEHARQLDLSTLDILYRSLSAVTVSSLYDDSHSWRGDLRLEIARMLGAIAFFTTVLGALTQLLRREVREAFARLRRGHVIVIGDHPVARAIAETAAQRKAKATWIAGEGADHSAAGVLTVQRRWDVETVGAFAARHAEHIVVALRDEVEQLATVRALRAAVPEVPICVSIRDPWFADRLDAIEDVADVRYISPVGLAIRRLHDRNPPFLIARALGQPRLHALMLGGGRAGEAVLNDLLLSQSTSFLDAPRVTVIDPRANEIAASFAQRAPDLYLSADLRFVAPDHAHDVRALPLAALREAQADCPFTLAYVSLDSDARTIRAAVALQLRARRDGWPMGPIYARLSAPGAFPGLAENRTIGTAAALVSWGDTHDLADEIGLFGGEADRLPRAFHEAYRRLAPEGAAHNQPWDALNQAARESNRQLMVHMPAKLASIGVDVAAWLAATNDGPRRRRPPPTPDLNADPELLERVAALEHTRWLSEKRLCGWQHGGARDNARRLHPALVPWEALGEHDRAFNRAMVAAMTAALGAAA
jgi:hypothetical protein